MTRSRRRRALARAADYEKRRFARSLRVNDARDSDEERVGVGEEDTAIHSGGQIAANLRKSRQP